MVLTVDPKQDAATAPVSGSLAATGQSAVFTPSPGRPVRLRLSGTWVGTAKVQRKDRGDATWRDMTAGGAAWASFTANCNEDVDEASEDAQYRVDFTRTSGTLEYRLGH